MVYRAALNATPPSQLSNRTHTSTPQLAPTPRKTSEPGPEVKFDDDEPFGGLDAVCADPTAFVGGDTKPNMDAIIAPTAAADVSWFTTA